jgi:Trypsin-like peptidase domain
MRSFLVAAVVASASISGAAQAAEISSGSGVMIGDHGEVLTNAHVVNACAQISVRSPAGDSATAQLIARDEKNDLAVVRAKPLSSVASFRDGKPVRAGDAIVVLGYPLAGLLATTANLTVGNVSALAGLGDDSRYLQISAPIQPGNSGGPLLDGSGHLVGIVTAKLDAAFAIRVTGDIPQNVNFALKAEVARTFLDSNGIAYHSAPSDKQLSPADIGDIARPFTLRIECEPISTQVAIPAAPTAPAPAAAPNAPAPPSQAAAPPSHPPTPDDICRALEQNAAENELPVEFFARVIWQESRFNAPQGTAQFIEALKNSARYLRDLKARFGNIGLAAAAYHAGPERVAAWLSPNHAPLPDETRSYVAIITGWTADQWASANPPKTSETTIPKGVPCTRLANLIDPKDKARMAAYVPRWGMQLTSAWSESEAWAKYRLIQKQYASLIGDREPMVVPTRGIGLGTAMRYNIRIGDNDRAYLERFCQKLIAAGGACVVLDNNKE